MLLLGKPGALHRWVIEFGVGIGDLHAGGECLKPFHVARTVGATLGQRRHILGVVDEKRGLHQMRFHVNRQHLVDEAAASLARSRVQAQLGGLADE